jgi:hypothetical protein
VGSRQWLLVVVEGIARIVVEGAHLRDLPALVVAAGEGDSIRVPHLPSVQ